MKQDKNEVAAVEAVILERENAILQLSDVQLALIGGGIGDVVFS
jgi:hypothetical protein